MRLKDDNKASLIREKAIEMIVSEGFDGLSMQKLAKAANISASTIYIYFENREDLLTKLYNEVMQDFENDALQGFDPEMDFETGLWLQWQNRYSNFTKNPTRFYFWEQFRNSPLVNRKDVKQSEFGIKMKQFVKNATERKEIIELSVDIFWAIAYSAFYTLIKFQVQRKDLKGNPYILTEEKMRQAFDLVLKALKP